MIYATARSAALSSALFLLTFMTLGCEDAPTESGPDPEAPPPSQSPAGAQGQQDREIQGQLVALRQATVSFQRFEQAREAGHGVLVTHPTTGASCLAHPTDGGMGRHYLNPDLVDGQVSVTEPEVVLYEPLPGGRLRLVGFEYIIPYAIRGPEETPPTLFGQDFLHNPTFELWMLHVYLWKNNPAGMFATWNRRITCDHDDAVG